MPAGRDATIFTGKKCAATMRKPGVVILLSAAMPTRRKISARRAAFTIVSRQQRWAFRGQYYDVAYGRGLRYVLSDRHATGGVAAPSIIEPQEEMPRSRGEGRRYSLDKTRRQGDAAQRE